MAAPGSLVVLRAVFAALGTLMVGTLVYTCATDGSPFRPELLTPWMVATLIDFYVNVIAISAWVIYKEANWISSAIWVVLLVCFGSAATCAYIVKKLFEVTPTGPSQDPLDLLLLRQGNLSQRKCSCVIAGRIIFSILGIFMAAVVTYTVITDGLPFRKELLTPWMAATLIDFYINIFAISCLEQSNLLDCMWLKFALGAGISSGERPGARSWNPDTRQHPGLGCSQGVILDINSHLDLLVDMLREEDLKIHRMDMFFMAQDDANVPFYLSICKSGIPHLR
ncbi:hypothetical protein EJB05_41367 [Eragrostis curvula]|uniref:Uncharacterized protein n=1 Tax=Eragrostis curvula TaxID=38414 RepID=A0A5J9T9B6_9POAL|nr:hypothetical protein EJB05_41367 [Eragrostis curvula]